MPTYERIAKLILSTCPNSRTIQIVTPMLEVYTLTYCPESECSIMKASSKTVLYCKLTHDRKVFQWPVAVFPNTDDARAYATFLRLAYRAKDHESILALDPTCAKDADGKPLEGAKWSMLTLPYAPVPELDTDDTAVADETPTT